MQSSREEQGEIRQSSYVNSAKIEVKIKWDRLKISLRKLDLSREYFMQRWAQYQRKAMPNNEKTTAQLHASHTLVK